ncbi:MAG: hypothetical protein AAFR45_10170 [Pseudomonadota bacterium]
MRIKNVIVLLAALAAVPSSGFTFQAENTLEVNQVNADVFEVVGRPGVMSNDYWCGAGDYVRRSLNMPWNTRIYISRELGKSDTTGKRSAVQFTMSPEKVGVTPWEGNWVSNILTLGYSMSATGAYGECRNGYRGSFFF